MSFWAQRLGQAAPAAPQQPAPQQPAPQQNNRYWWAPAAPQQAAPQAPVAPTQVPQQQQQQVPSDQEVNLGVLLTQVDYTTQKAESNRDSATCPSCGSGNYLSAKTDSRAGKRCFDCGHNDRFEQSMSGMSGSGQNIPVRAARVQQGNVSNFNPRQIVGKV